MGHPVLVLNKFTGKVAMGEDTFEALQQFLVHYMQIHVPAYSDILSTDDAPCKDVTAGRVSL